MGPECTHPTSLLAHGLDPLDASVVESFRRATHLNRKVFMHAIGVDRPGHPGRAGMLLMLGASPDGMTQRQVADALRVSAPTVTVMLQKLEADGVIERWTDPDDQRLTRIRMTQAGRDESARISERYSEFVKASVGRMSEDDRRELVRLLGVFADQMTEALAAQND